MNDNECPRCGNEMEPGEKCRTCGYDPWSPIVEIVRKPASKVAKVISIFAFILVGLPSCCIGGCALFLGGLSARDSGGQASAYLTAFGGAAVFALLLWWMIEANRHK